MESTVDKLEAMFLKSEADLEYIEKRLKLDFINNTSDHPSSSEVNPALMLEKLKVIKAKHSSLSSTVKQILESQKLSMDQISCNINASMELIHHFTKATDVEIEALSGPEQEAAAVLSSACNHNKAETPGLAEQKYQDVT